MTIHPESDPQPDVARALHRLIQAVATASPDRRQLLTDCQRCRNRMLYLIPRATGGQLAARLGALPLDHERHGEATHPDDNPPDLGGITCPRCGKTSHNENDVREGYCGNCHDWTGEHRG